MIHISHTPAALLARQRQTLALRALALVLPPWFGVLLWAYLTPLISPGGNARCNFIGVTFIPLEEHTIEQRPPLQPAQISPPAMTPASNDILLSPALTSINQSQLPALPAFEPDEYPFETNDDSLIVPQVQQPPSPASRRQTSTDAGIAEKAPYTPPAYKQCPEPPYPARMRQQRVRGSVVLNLSINAEGIPTAGEITQSSGHATLDKHALNWVLTHWRFSPARRNNTPCDSRVSTTLHFTL